MGTRADFYIGVGPDSEWLGSIAWDGYLEGIPDEVLGAKSEEEWRRVVTEFIAGRKDGTPAARGWPWPWDDSSHTDRAYTWVSAPEQSGIQALLRLDNDVQCWMTLEDTMALHEIWNSDASFEEMDAKTEEFLSTKKLETPTLPDMSSRRNMAPPGSHASGIMMIVAVPKK